MSATLSVSPATQSVIDECKQYTQMCKSRLAFTLSFVPEDKLTYAPGESSRSALQITAHTALSNYNFAAIIRGDPLPTDLKREDVMAMMAEKEAAITTADKAIEVLDESTAEVLAALDGVTDETVNREVVTPFITAPMAFWMKLPGRHMDNHSSQIDYLQTTWGDMAWHMPQR